MDNPRLNIHFYFLSLLWVLSLLCFTEISDLQYEKNYPERNANMRAFVPPRLSLSTLNLADFSVKKEFVECGIMFAFFNKLAQNLGSIGLCSAYSTNLIKANKFFYTILYSLIAPL